MQFLQQKTETGGEPVPHSLSLFYRLFTHAYSSSSASIAWSASCTKKATAVVHCQCSNLLTLARDFATCNSDCHTTMPKLLELSLNQRRQGGLTYWWRLAYCGPLTAIVFCSSLISAFLNSISCRACCSRGFSSRICISAEKQEVVKWDELQLL